MAKTHAQIMEDIWDKIPKQPDGKTIKYSLADIDFLYYEGFVDTRRYSLAQWRKAMLPFQKDDAFVITKPVFVSLRRFRYIAESYEAFDPMKIREGSWSDKSLALLYKRSIREATEMPEQIFWDLINKLKACNKCDAKGNFIIDEHVKIGILSFLANFPSPRSRLEYKVKKLKEQGPEAVRKNAGNAKGFSAGATAVETTLASLQQLQGVSAEPAKADAAPADDKNSIDIKKMRRPTGKVFG